MLFYTGVCVRVTMHEKMDIQESKEDQTQSQILSGQMQSRLE